jgi:hypothetical protein
MELAKEGLFARYYTVFGFRDIVENRYTKKMVPLDVDLFKQILLSHKKSFEAAEKNVLTVVISWYDPDSACHHAEHMQIIADDDLCDTLKIDIINKICLQY